ncbi:aminotransferase class V-fold PLP-dependent enzyme [Bowmanella denitrificans]|uniref:Aminotransferase class V-fold PLP-dependent enzyme n=1 Tax=Bowmanella denitrificans TaxID=366582 RepID=A0ABN0WLM9_9ALTE
MSSFTRRQFLTTSLASAAAGSLLASPAGWSAPLPTSAQSPLAQPRDEAYWAQVASQYEVRPGIINVENGNWGIMAKPVMQAYFKHTERVNRDNSYFSRRQYWPLLKDIVAAVADRLAAKPEEIGLTRGATEALQNLIGGFNGLSKGDALMYADLDYGAMQDAMRTKSAQCGAEVIELAIPEPVDHQGLIDFYQAAFTRHPHCKLLLLTHISHRTGLVMPVKEITAAARQKGIAVIVDAAHSWGQMDVDVADLGADFIGFNLHKWMGAPLGVGVMYIRQGKLGQIAANMSASPGQEQSIWGKFHSGTSNFAAFLSVPDAFAFHDQIGARAKAARLQYLRNLWVDEVRQLEGIDILTPQDPRLYAGITSFRIKGHTSSAQNRAIAEYLLAEHQVFCVHRDGIDNGSCVRITPSLYNSAADLKLTAKAIAHAVSRFAA